MKLYDESTKNDIFVRAKKIREKHGFYRTRHFPFRLLQRLENLKIKEAYFCFYYLKNNFERFKIDVQKAKCLKRDRDRILKIARDVVFNNDKEIIHHEPFLKLVFGVPLRYSMPDMPVLNQTQVALVDSVFSEVDEDKIIVNVAGENCKKRDLLSLDGKYLKIKGVNNDFGVFSFTF